MFRPTPTRQVALRLETFIDIFSAWVCVWVCMLVNPNTINFFPPPVYLKDHNRSKKMEKLNEKGQELKNNAKES